MKLTRQGNDRTRQTRRTIDAMGGVLCLALAALLYAVGIHPVLQQRHEQQQTRQQVVTERGEVAASEASLTRLRKQYVTVQRAVADNALRLEPLAALNRRVAELTAMARDAELEIDGVRPGQPSPSDHYRTVPVTVTGHGSFSAVNRFLNRLHTDLPDVGVWSLEIDRRRLTANAAPPAFELELIWYAAPPSP